MRTGPTCPTPPDEFREWPYFVSIFGEPVGGEPWAWVPRGRRAAGRHRSEHIAKRYGLTDYAHHIPRQPGIAPAHV
jgi:hypothetical protein